MEKPACSAVVKLPTGASGLGLEYLNVSKDELLGSPLVSPARLAVDDENAPFGGGEGGQLAAKPSLSPLKDRSVNLQVSPGSPFEKVGGGKRVVAGLPLEQEASEVRRRDGIEHRVSSRVARRPPILQ